MFLQWDPVHFSVVFLFTVPEVEWLAVWGTLDLGQLT